MTSTHLGQRLAGLPTALLLEGGYAAAELGDQRRGRAGRHRRRVMAEHVDCVVIGAGVVGLAVYRALALAGREC